MKQITLTQAKFSLVDDETFDFLNQWRWKFDKTNGYACRTLYPKGKIYLHSLIIDSAKGFVIDHINRNKLDNRKENLRVISYRQNSFNTSLRVTNTSGYRGIHWLKGRKKWEAYIWNNYKKIHLGLYLTIQEAWLARRLGERRYPV